MKSNYLKKYIISSYILVWALIIFVAGTASLVFHAPPVIMGTPMLSYINFGITALPLSIFLSFTSGPTGEELGWRGFMREEFNKRYGFLKSSVCQGLVWCFWHTLLWAVDSEFTDWRAVPYVISNIVVITCMTVLMNIFLEWHNNLIYSVLLHFGFNIIYVFLEADIGFFIILIILYLLITPFAVLARNRLAGKHKKQKI